MIKVDVQHLIEIAKLAGSEILKVYNQDSFDLEVKSDNSPLTEDGQGAYLIK